MRAIVAEVREHAIRDYVSGSSSLVVAKRYGVDKGTVLDWLVKAKVDRRSNSEARRRFCVDETFFKKIDTEEKAYWLGFLLADGNVGKTGRACKARQLRCALQIRDRGHLERLRKALHSSHPIKEKTAFIKKKSYLCCWLVITSKALVGHLETAGWHRFKKRGDTSILENVPSRLKRHLVRGLIDGDGCIHKSKENKLRIMFVDLHRSVVSWVQNWIMNKAGVMKTKICHPSRAYCFGYTGNIQVPKIIHLLYSDAGPYLQRKLSQAFPIYHPRR